MNVLDELTEPEERLDRSYVEPRIDDWRHRIGCLYEDVAKWLPARWTVSDGGSVPMREDLMQRFDLPSQDMPILSLNREGSPLGRLEPRGSWIIGANGRVDLLLPEKYLLFIDRSDCFEDPDWRVASIDHRRDQRPLSRDVTMDIFN